MFEAPATSLEPDPPPPLPVLPVPAFDAELAEGTPSGQTILMLLHTEPTSLGRDEAVAGAVGVAMATRMLEALGARFQAQAAGRQPLNREVDEAAQELSAGLGLHPHTATAQITAARGLVRRLPVTMKAWEAGGLNRRQAEHVESLTRDLDRETAQAVEAAAVPGNPRRLNQRLLREIARLAPEALVKKVEQQRKQRLVDFWSDPLEGVAGLAVQGPLAEVEQIKAAINAEAKTCPAGECREVGARRFDALLGWARRALGLDEPTEPAPKGRCGSCGRSGPPRIPITVTVSAETLLRLSETPGELDGVGPLPADVVRELAANGDWRRFLVSETGQLLDVGATTYRPRVALERFVRGRDRTCRFPTCNASAVRCDLDHTLAFHGEHGETTDENLVALCRHHHRLKHETEWRYWMEPTGDVVWVAPSGRRYVKPAEYHGDDPWLNDIFRSGSLQDARHAGNDEREPEPEPMTGREGAGANGLGPDVRYPEALPARTAHLAGLISCSAGVVWTPSRPAWVDAWRRSASSTASIAGTSRSSGGPST